jgi:hypothetical protein
MGYCVRRSAELWCQEAWTGLFPLERCRVKAHSDIPGAKAKREKQFFGNRILSGRPSPAPLLFTFVAASDNASHECFCTGSGHICVLFF